MRDIAIQVEGLTKAYRLGVRTDAPETLVQSVVATLTAPIRNFRRLRRLNTFATERGADDILWALKDVSFEVGVGEVLGIIGRNGAGKSTLLKILSRISEPTAGRAIIRGRVSSLLEVGTGFHPELTGRENVYMNGTILGMRKNEINSKFDEIVEFSGVERFLDTPVKRYSSGMKVRLAFSVAAHLEPEVLIVDEVLAVGDAAFQNKCLGKMSEVTRGGRTVLFVSHNMAAVQALCTRGIVLNGGQSIYDGDAGEAIAKYTLATQETISAVDLNSRTDRVGGEQLRFDTIEFMDTETMDSLQTAISGQAVTVKLSFTNHSGEVLKNVGFSIGFYTASGQYLCGSRSDTVNSTYSVRPGKGVVFCRFPKWPLNGGRYVFNILAERQGERLDWVKEAGFIAVQAGDYYGSGKMPATEIPSVLIEYSWEAGL